jgi:hypothetical protein
MKKNTALRILNLVLVVLFVNQAVTVLFLEELSFRAFQIFHKGGGAVLLTLHPEFQLGQGKLFSKIAGFAGRRND